MTIEVTPVLGEITALLLSVLRSKDPRRFVLVHDVSRTAQKLVRAVSLRVADFDDPHRVKKGAFFKSLGSPSPALVPPHLDVASLAVLDAMTHAIECTLESSTATRFTQVEAITDAALHFIASVTPVSNKQETAADAEDTEEIVCENPEQGYIQHTLRELRGAPATDTNELRREILEIEGAQSQVLAELALAKIAREEAAELEHLLAVQKSSADIDLLGPATERIEQLRQKLVFRTKGTNGVVPTHLLRGHQSRGEEAWHDGAQGHTGDTRRAEGTRDSTQAGAGEALRMLSLGDA